MKPVLLLIPGMFNTAAIWDALLPLLAPTMDVHIADVLTQDTIAGMAEDAWTQVQDVAPGTVLLVCGFSMGGHSRNRCDIWYQRRKLTYLAKSPAIHACQL